VKPSAQVVFRHKDGSVLDGNGRELFLGLDRFKALVKDTKRCFVCGAHEDNKSFNDEHVIPDWVQRSCGLRDKSIRLSNGTDFPYRNYKIRCCEECNSFLGKTFEAPIANALSRGPDYFFKWYQSETFRVFLWLNLIYLKTHLKDNQLRLVRDQRAPDTRLGDLYDWTELHHCHAMVRAAKLGFEIDTEKVQGSLFLFQLDEWAREQPYDYNDHLPTHTVMIRLGEVAFICALNDSCGVFNGLMPKIEKLPPNLNPLQFLEILTEFQFVNAHLKFRPKYKTEVDRLSGRVTISATIPEQFELEELDFSLRGEFMVRNLYGSLGKFELKGLTQNETKAHLLTGDVTFFETEAAPTNQNL
jgi:hypothetical protein